MISIKHHVQLKLYVKYQRKTITSQLLQTNSAIFSLCAQKPTISGTKTVERHMFHIEKLCLSKYKYPKIIVIKNFPLEYNQELSTEKVIVVGKSLFE